MLRSKRIGRPNFASDRVRVLVKIDSLANQPLIDEKKSVEAIDLVQVN